MVPKTYPNVEVIAWAESYDGIQVGIVNLKAVLKGPSYPVAPNGLSDAQHANWPDSAQSVLVLGLHHPKEDPRLDYWESGDTWGNRRLKEISLELQHWLRWTYHVYAYPLPYDVKKGGVFLKDAAVLSGIGIIGRNNLLIHPTWGPRIRLRAVLLENEFQPTGVLEGFSPCQTCKVFCQKACPVEAFPRGIYNRRICTEQMHENLKNRVPYGEIGESGKRNLVIRHCRACEMSCPVGA